MGGMETLRKRSAIGLLVIGFLFTVVQSLWADLPGRAAPETVSGRLTSKNGRSWRYAYDISLKGNAVQVSVGIRLVPAAGVSGPALENAMRQWKKGIEETWSDRFAIVAPDGSMHPIAMNVSFGGRDCHHTVIVRPGGGPSDELNWHIKDSAAIAAHEFGHMLGAWDEYARGALSPDTKRVDPTSVMACNPAGGSTHPRHYQKFLHWFEQNSATGPVTLVPNHATIVTTSKGETAKRKDL